MKMVMKKLALAAASAMLVTAIGFASNARPAYAAAKVDCDAVMNELNSGKHEKDVATDLSTTLYQVRKCKRKAKAASKAETKSSIQAKTGKEAPMNPMSAPSPAMAAPAAPAAAASPK
jgi:peptidoglycan hydrolase CwlO-like protein